MSKSKREKLLAILSLIAFALKSFCNIVFIRELVQTFTTYDIDLAPAGSPLLLCRISFVLPYSLVTALYCVASTFFSKSGNKIIETKFYISFTCSCIFEAACASMLAYSFMVPAFVFLCATSLFQCAALHQAFIGLYNAKRSTELRARTIWCHRILVQSSLVFDCAWNFLLTILILAILLCYTIGLSSFQASVIGLAIFAVGLLTWFLIENLVIEKYVRFTGVEYIAFSIALTCLLTSNHISGTIIPIAILSLMSTVLILLFLRMFAIICLESRRKARDELYTVVQV